MVEFDFEARGGGNGVSARATNAFSISLTLTDAINDTGGPVKFSVSYSGSYSTPTPFIGEANAFIADVLGVGFDIENLATTISDSRTILPTAQSLSVQLLSSTVGGNNVLTGNATLETLFGNTITASAVGGAVTFSVSSLGTGANITSLNFNLDCFCAGTQIATSDGPCAVEDLQPGDMVLLANGQDVPVRWIGRQNVDTRLRHPKAVNPICITAGSLGEDLPKRDLRVSPDHGIAMDGILINAGALVNGTTIYQEQDIREDFTYYHIGTDAHDLILAEGVAAETFIDYTTRDLFENAHEVAHRVIPEMPLPRISSPRLVPHDIHARLSPAIAAE